MSKSRLVMITGVIPVVLALTTTGCATKKYVSAQIAPVNAKIGALEAAAKEQADKEQAKGEVTFGFNRSNLDKADQGTLDALVQQARSAPRAEFELLGFTDPVGAPAYNLELSRRRAESVARYLVRQGIAVRGIHLVGFGKEPVPSDLLADVPTVDPNTKDAESRRVARRVVIRIYAPAGNPPGATVVTSSQQ